MRCKAFIFTVTFEILFCVSAQAACSSYTTLTNGTTADANDVMHNFNCAALTSGASLENVQSLGIGMVPSNILDITQNQNLFARGNVFNSSTGAAARAGFRGSNGTNATEFGQLGQSYSSSGVMQAGNGFIKGDAGLSVASLGGSIVFAASNSGNLAEVARFGTDGSFLINTTANGGWIGNAKAEVYSAGNTAFSVYSSSPTYGVRALSVRVDDPGVYLQEFITKGRWSEPYRRTEQLQALIPLQIDV